MNPSVAWSNDEITVWQFPLTATSEELDRLSSVLSPYEFAWAHSFGKPEARKASIVRRGQLRILLAEQLQVTPKEIEFESLAFGKPIVKGSDLHFSATSCLEYGGVAISKTRQIGLDLEHPDRLMVAPHWPGDDFDDYDHFLANTKEERLQRYVQDWCRREALGKASGHGIRTLDAIPTPEPFATIKFFDLEAQVHDIPAPDGYHQSIAWMVD